MFKRLVPHPLLTLLIVVVWILLNGISWGALVLGAVLGLAIPKLTSPYWSDRPHIGSPFTILEYAVIVLWDIVVANFQVAYLILFRRGDSLRPVGTETLRAEIRARNQAEAAATSGGLLSGLISLEGSAELPVSTGSIFSLSGFAAAYMAR